MRRTALFVALTTFAALGADPARAGRALEEPPGLAKIVRSAPKAELDKLLDDRCRGALQAPDLLGIECRGRAAAAWVRRKPAAGPKDVDARRTLLADLAKAADQVSTWAPLSPPPGLGRARFDAHRALTTARMALADDVAQVKPAAPPAPGDAKDVACKAAQRTVELATGADASLEERGAAQALVTSHRCFLDESRLKVEPKPGLALKESEDAKSVAASTSSAGAILAYAQSRSLDLERCEKHLDAGGKVKDKSKLEQCACGAIARWKLPHASAATTTNVPVAGAASVTLDVAPTGAVTRCALAAP